MAFLFFDTETTGLPLFNAPGDHPAQPDCVQIAGLLADEDHVLGQFNFIVQSDKESHPKAIEAHGITAEIIAAYGVPRKTALNVFHNIMKKAEGIVAHNADFDMKVIRIMYAQENVKAPDFPPSFCTMKTSVETCKIPKLKGSGYKWPSLQEAFRVLVDPKGFDGAHNAMVDVTACYEVWKKLRVIGIAPGKMAA